jgi:hypothetical protein
MAVWKNSETRATDPLRVMTVLVSVDMMCISDMLFEEDRLQQYVVCSKQ